MIVKQFDLEDRTLLFAKDVRAFIKKVPKSISNIEDCKQLNRSSGSVGANYIEANESLSKKDFLMRIKISKKEAKESRYWLTLLDLQDNEKLGKERQRLMQECTEFIKILSTIQRNSS